MTNICVKPWIVLAGLCLISACSGGGGDGGATGVPAPELGAALPDADGIGFLQTEWSVAENQRVLSVNVFRAGTASGASTVTYSVSGGSATVELDYQMFNGSVSWADGETGIKSIPLTVYSDLDQEVAETIELELLQTEGTGLLPTASTASVSLVDSACDTIIGGQAAGSVHLQQPCSRLTGSLDFGPGDQFTAAPGATLIADAGVAVVVHAGASVALIGDSERPVMLRGATAQPGSWTGLELRDSDEPNNSLTHVVLRDADTGVSINRYSALGEFANNSITGNQFPIRIPGTLAHTLDRASSFTGNTRDYVVLASGNMDASHYFPALDVPYLSSNTVVINGELEIEAGTELHFAEGDLMFVSTTGSLRAVGTANEPIVFTGEQSIPGFWRGIHFSTEVNGSSVLDYTHVSYAGGDRGRPGNIALFGGAPNVAITNSVISHSLGHGIWVHADQSTIDTQGTEFLQNGGQDVFNFN